MSLKIMRRSAVLLLCCLLASGRTTSAEGVVARSLDELVTPADVIARVVIVSEYIDHTWSWRTGYYRVAFGRVLDPIKGTARNQLLRLYHDNGNYCANVRYQRGEELLLFARRRGKGYEAIWWMTGIMPVTGGNVRHDLFPKGAAYRDVRSQVERLLLQAPRPSA